MTSPEIDVGSCWETLFMMVYGIWIANNCIMSVSISQVILFFVIGVDTETHMTFPCFEWASTLPFALFSHSVLHFRWNNKKTI